MVEIALLKDCLFFRYDYLDRLETSRVASDVSSRLELDPTSAMARSSYITGSSVVFERKSDLGESRYNAGSTVADRLETARRLRATTPSPPPPSSSTAINSTQRSSATATRHLY